MQSHSFHLRLLSFFALILFASTSFAGHTVRGYHRKDGTYVAPHYSRNKGERTISRETNSGAKIHRSRSQGIGATSGKGNSHGNGHRSEAAKSAFKKSHPCPSTGSSRGACPGYVIDHITPLKRGGADDPRNMQWQTDNQAKQKDKWE